MDDDNISSNESPIATIWTVGMAMYLAKDTRNEGIWNLDVGTSSLDSSQSISVDACVCKSTFCKPRLYPWRTVYPTMQ